MVAFIAAMKLIGKAPNRSQSAMLNLNQKNLLCHRETSRKFLSLNRPCPATRCPETLRKLLEALHYNARKKLAIEKLAGSFALDLGFGAYNYGIIKAYKT